LDEKRSGVTTKETKKLDKNGQTIDVQIPFIRLTHAFNAQDIEGLKPYERLIWLIPLYKVKPFPLYGLKGISLQLFIKSLFDSICSNNLSTSSC
jgi:hypothetical protein